MRGDLVVGPVGAQYGNVVGESEGGYVVVLPVGGFYGVAGVDFGLVVVDGVGQAVGCEAVAEGAGEGFGGVAAVNGLEDPTPWVGFYEYLVCE